MFIASVSTIIFNANPLLRYDGYYILADLLEIPNLRQKATTILSRKAGEWFLGLEPGEDPFLPQRNQVFFALYSVAAAAYRWLIVLSILWFLYRVFKPYRLEIIGQAIVVVALVGLFIQPLYRLGKFFYVPGRLEKVKKPRMYASLAALGAVVAAFLFVPLPYHVIASLEIQARDAQPVYVVVPGELAEVYVQPGNRVTEGQPLAQLTSFELDKRIKEMEAEKERYEIELADLLRQQIRDPQVASSIAPVEESLRSQRLRLLEAKEEQKRLRLKAPEAGTVLPPPALYPPTDPEGPLPTWSGTPFVPKNLGCYLKEGTLFCQVGDPTKREAVLVINEADRPFVEVGQEVAIKLDALPHEIIEGTIERISPEQMKVSPRGLSGKSGGELATKTNPATGVEQPLETSYQASVSIDDDDQILRLGLRGRAKIHMDSSHWQTLGQQLLAVPDPDVPLQNVSGPKEAIRIARPLHELLPGFPRLRPADYNRRVGQSRRVQNARSRLDARGSRHLSRVPHRLGLGDSDNPQRRVAAGRVLRLGRATRGPLDRGRADAARQSGVVGAVAAVSDLGRHGGCRGAAPGAAPLDGRTDRTWPPSHAGNPPRQRPPPRGDPGDRVAGEQGPSRDGRGVCREGRGRTGRHVHLVMVDLFPPGRFDPQGMHAVYPAASGGVGRALRPAGRRAVDVGQLRRGDAGRGLPGASRRRRRVAGNAALPDPGPLHQRPAGGHLSGSLRRHARLLAQRA